LIFEKIQSGPRVVASVRREMSDSGAEAAPLAGVLRALPTTLCTPAGQISAWAREDGVQPYGLYQGQRLVACGELWVDDQEAEVEPARLIVDPGVRGRGLGRHLAAGLAHLASLRHTRVFLRVHPGNTAALRCYAAAGFEPVAPDQAAAWNVGQPIGYVWLSLAT
jgi:ribosomal protein S18 acetylase RimI-like enzyme